MTTVRRRIRGVFYVTSGMGMKREDFVTAMKRCAHHPFDAPSGYNISPIFNFEARHSPEILPLPSAIHAYLSIQASGILSWLLR